MKRLLFPALMAFAIHAFLFWMEIPWSRPSLMLPQSKAVSIDLVTFQKPVEKPAPPPPVVKPRPKPRPKPKAKLEPVVKPAILPQPPAAPVVPEPVPAPARIEETLPPEAAAETHLSEEDAMAVESPATDAIEPQAAVQASVPLYDLNPPPQYPRVARRRNYQGTVLLEVRVTVEGLAAEVRIAESSGYGVLDRSAVRAVQGWRFSPAKRANVPFEMWVKVPVRFQLN